MKWTANRERALKAYGGKVLRPGRRCGFTSIPSDPRDAGRSNPSDPKKP